VNQVELRALVVEDDPAWQNILREMMTDLGMAVDVAGEPDEAIRLLRSAVHRIALVDLSLDKADHRNRFGLQVLDAVKQYDPGCVAIMLTAHATVDLAVKALTEYGAYTCLQKESFTRSEFRKLLKQVLSRSAPTVTPPDGVQPEAQEQPAVAPADVKSASTIGTALVIEDDAGWRNLMSELLTDFGYRVRLCSSFGEAVGCLGREKYDLAVVDLSLTSYMGTLQTRPRSGEAGGPHYEGFRLLGTMRAANIPTVVVTGVTSVEDIEWIYAEYGVLYCLEKQTFDRAAFRRVIDEIQTSRPANAELKDLTEREYQVLALLARGLTNKEIAETLFISTNTVKRHLKAVFSKLGTSTRAAAATKAASAGILTR
jgi:DNA-binding NarL/FixJ family response regulator